MEVYLGSDGRLPLRGQVNLKADVNVKLSLESGCGRVEAKALPTFTTLRPSDRPPRKPAGLKDCSEHELERWRAARHQFPPYQFKDCHCIRDAQGKLRPPKAMEREATLGFPTGYTVQCMRILA